MFDSLPRLPHRYGEVLMSAWSVVRAVATVGSLCSHMAITAPPSTPQVAPAGASHTVERLAKSRMH